MTVDVRLPCSAYVTLALHALGSIVVSRASCTSVTGPGSAARASVSWELKTKGIVMRAYNMDCSRRHFTGTSGSTLRVERQWRPNRAPLVDGGTLDVLGPEFSRYMRPALKSGVLVPNTYMSAVEKFHARKGSTTASAERAIGSYVCLAFGATEHWDARTSRRRRREVSRAGLTPPIGRDRHRRPHAALARLVRSVVGCDERQPHRRP